MYVGGAVILTIAISVLVNRWNDQDRKDYRAMGDELYPLVLHIRQDLKFIAILLGGVIVMLGVVAEVIANR